MAYRPPSGNKLRFRFGVADYSPPGPSAIELEFLPDPAILIRRSAAASGVWNRSAGVAICRQARHGLTASSAATRLAPWSVGVRRGADQASAWLVTARRDMPSQSSVWLGGGGFLHHAADLAWRQSFRMDGLARSGWGVMTHLSPQTPLSRWVSSLRADRERLAPWCGNIVRTWRQIPYHYPPPDGVDFSVAGGGLRFVFQAGAYSQPTGDAIVFALPDTGYSPPSAMPSGWSGDDRVSARADFVSAPPVEVRVDGVGLPITDKNTADATRQAPWGRSARLDADRALPWVRYSRQMNPGWGIVVPPGPIAPEPGQQIVIPVLRTYIVLNETLFTRADDNTVIVASNLSISFDADSWLPKFSASIRASQIDVIWPDPAPVEISAYINGAQFSFRVERIARSRQFGSAMLDISGTALASELAAPYAASSSHTNATGMTAQQIISAALEFTDYSVDWDITDWLVPAGVFDLQGTPADVAAHVADAAGATLQAGFYDRSLRVLPRYPVVPWEWSDATPDVVIPASVTQTESVDWSELPDYNVVYVSGVTDGITGRVLRAGSAGDNPAPMVTHPLITHADAARQKGTSILGKSGKRAALQISLPIIPEYGLIDLSKLVEFSDGTNTRRGIVRGNNITVGWPTVRQTLTIEASA